VKAVSGPPERPIAKSGPTETLLGPVATTFATVHTGSWRTERPDVDFARCSKCGLCAQHCPAGVIELRKEDEHCVFIEWYTCKGCGICADVCPKQCISMIPEIADGGH
jgi:2-oxoacid:acceptor oxidoreductase delta subunit (pyruvate/2-ketoisovalerate family)